MNTEFNFVKVWVIVFIGVACSMLAGLYLGSELNSTPTPPIIHDTIYLPESTKTILQKSDSISIAFGVPPQLVREIGNNESGWRHIHNHDGSSRGDLQVIGATFKHWYKELGLKGGKTRENYLIVGIAYLKYCYDFSGSWKKARYVYARGKWNPEWKWTALERKFMSKINWSDYD